MPFESKLHFSSSLVRELGQEADLSLAMTTTPIFGVFTPVLKIYGVKEIDDFHPYTTTLFLHIVNET